MDSFGAYLKGFRESKGIRLEEIASITKIHLHNLELLESDRWEKLPPDPFLRGFIVAYGKYVGLDPKELLQRYLDLLHRDHPHLAAAATSTQATSTEESPSAPQPGDLIEQNPGVSTKKLAGGLGIVLIVGLLGGIVYLGKRATDQSLHQTTAERSSATESATAPSAPTNAAVPAPTTSSPAASAPNSTVAAAPTAPAADGKNAAAPVPAPGATGHKISVEGSERTWIKVVVDDKAPIEYFLPQGDKVSYDAKDKIKVVLGNATGAKVFYNGKQTDGVSFLGTIRSYKFPPDADFPQDTTSRRTATSAGEGAPPSKP
jgi:cytoskeleton protein RodZ